MTMMRMRQQYSIGHICLFILICVAVVFAGASEAADSVTVSGDVKNKQTMSTIANFNVGLYPNEQKQGGQLANDTTSGEGIYSMKALNVGKDVAEVWVVSEMSYQTACPVSVDLRPSRTAKAQKPLLVESQANVLSSNSMNRAAHYTAAVFETRGIQSYSGAITRSDAQQEAFFETYPLLITQKLAGTLNSFWQAVFDSFQEPIRRNEILWQEVRDIYEGVRSMMFGE
jgi:hypothetical protein